jgi:hypothetical protein
MVGGEVNKTRWRNGEYPHSRVSWVP